MASGSTTTIKNERLKLETRTAGNIDKELKRLDSFASYRSLSGFVLPKSEGRSDNNDAKNEEQVATCVNDMPPKAPKSTETKEKRGERKKHKKTREERARSHEKNKENLNLNKSFNSEADLASSSKNERKPGEEDDTEFLQSLNRLHRRRRQNSEVKETSAAAQTNFG